LNQCLQCGYDEFNRLTSLNVNTGTPENYDYAHDRYGNRWSQTPLSGGLTESLSFNTANNQVNSAGFAYDAAGNMTNDAFHSYLYDAEGNMVSAL
jgi:hypothetical protein